METRYHKKNAPIYIERLRTALRRMYGSECAICGTKRKLEFAHIKPTKLKGMSRGSKQRVLDVLKYPGSYWLLCKPCHDWFDYVEMMKRR